MAVATWGWAPTYAVRTAVPLLLYRLDEPRSSPSPSRPWGGR